MKPTYYFANFAMALISSINFAHAGITKLNTNGTFSVTNASGNGVTLNIYGANGAVGVLNTNNILANNVNTDNLYTSYINTAGECDFNGVRIGRGSGNIGNNTAVGFAAMDGVSPSGDLCTAVGSYAMYRNSSGSSNTAIGHAALVENTSGSNNTASGMNALRINGSGNNNTAMGMTAAYYTQGNGNSAFGVSALHSNVSGGDNTAIGVQALQNTNSSYNTGVGGYALHYNTTGHSNIALGHNAGLVHANGTTPLTTTSGSIYIGVNSRGFSNADSNSIVIGAGAWGEGANTTVIGNGATVKTHLFGQTVTSSLKVDGATVLNGSVILAAPQGDISMGAYQ
jgi:hypothetical protein